MLWLFRTSRSFHLSILGDILLLDTTMLHFAQGAGILASVQETLS